MSGNGAYLQLAAYGAQNVYLTGNPQITFFIAQYKRHTNFAIECIEQYLHGNMDFGTRLYAKVIPSGDLLYTSYVYIDLGQLNPQGTTTDSEIQFSWVNSIGHVILKSIEIDIGGNMIDKHYGQWLEIWTDLTIPAGQVNAYNNLVGKNQNFNATIQGGAMKLRIPMQFWFNRHLGCALPLIALQNDEVRFYVDLERFNRLWVATIQGVQPSQIPSIKATIYTDQIFLDTAERKIMAKMPHWYLIEQLQITTQSFTTDSTDNIMPLYFNHPVKTLYWVFQNGLNLTNDHVNGLQVLNFSDRPYNADFGAGGGDIPTDIMLGAQLKIEGQDRFSKQDAKYFRVQQPFQYMTRTPDDNFIYMYSFSTDPVSYQPTGACNFSMIDNADIYTTICKNIINPRMTVYAVNLNIWMVVGGTSGVLYAD